MSIRIGNASIDENGEISGGKIGDQTGKEIYERDWYQHKHPWNVYLECTDPTLAKSAAEYMGQICNDPNYGYNQNERTTGYVSIIKNGRRVKGAKGSFDCSSSVSGCYNLAGIPSLSINNTTRTLRNALLRTGKFVEYTDSSHLLSGKLAKVGGIYLSEGHHVVMVIHVDKVPTKPSNPYSMPSSDIEFGETGASVRWVQWELIRHGYNVKMDGEFGSKTEKYVKDFQKVEGLTIDGIVGPDTRMHLCK